MSDTKTQLELSILEGLKTLSGLGAVKTWENSIRECLFTGEKLTQGYRPAELPAVAVSAQLKPTKGGLWTAGERQLDVPVSLTIVTRAMKPKDALAAAAELQDVIEQQLGLWRKSANPLGMNAWVTGDVSASATHIDERPLAFAISTTEFNITKVFEL